MALNRTNGGSTFLKHAEHTADIVILVEPIKVDRDVEDTYKGQTVRRDVAHGDFTFFGTQESLDKGEPTEIGKGLKTNKVGMVREMGEQLGDQFVAVIRKIVTNSGNDAFVFQSGKDDVSDATFDLVSKYLDARDAETKANLDSVPDF